MATSGIYKITNKLTGAFYIGSSVDIEHRWVDHIGRLRKGNYSCVILQRAWNKYGEDAFTFSIVEEVERDKDLLLAREQFYIDTLSPEYNCTFLAGSHLGMKRSEETKEKLRNRVLDNESRQKISRANRGRKPTEEQKAKHLAVMQSPEHREKLKLARNRRLPASEESRAKMREAQRINNNKPGARERQRQSHLGKVFTPEHCANITKAKMGHPVSEESRERMRQSHLGKQPTPETRARMSEAQRRRQERERYMKEE